MPQTVYKQVTDAEGNVTFEPVEVPTPEEVATLQAKLKAANDEAAAKRHELKRIKEAQPAQGSAGQVEDTPSDPTPAATPTQPVAPATPVINEDAIVDKAIERISAQRAKEEADEAEILALLAKHGIPPSDDNKATLRDSRNPADTAARLGRERLKFAPAHAGNSLASSNTLSAAVSAFRSMGLKHPDDPEK